MNLDVRVPIGLMFAVFGVMLSLYGWFSDPEIYKRSLGINVNLWWGIIMLVFGLIMLLLARLGSVDQSQQQGKANPQPRNH